MFYRLKKARKYRWGLFISDIGWEDYLGFAILIIGVLGFFDYPILGFQLPYITGWTDFYHEIWPELIGIGIAVLIIDNANEAIKRREEKKRLILQMGSPKNQFAIEAVRQLREMGWLTDGSLQGANLKFANLVGANLGSANQEEAILVGTNLEGATRRRANMSGGYLNRANLRRADLSEADLWLADLRKAKLDGALLLEANLKDGVVTPEQLAKAKPLEGAIMPDGSKYEEAD